MITTYETRLTVPTAHMGMLTRMLKARGCVILDRGERIATDEGDDAEAVLHVLFLPQASVEADTVMAEASAQPA